MSSEGPRCALIIVQVRQSAIWRYGSVTKFIGNPLTSDLPNTLTFGRGLGRSRNVILYGIIDFTVSHALLFRVSVRAECNVLVLFLVKNRPDPV